MKSVPGHTIAVLKNDAVLPHGQHRLLTRRLRAIAIEQPDTKIQLAQGLRSLEKKRRRHESSHPKFIVVSRRLRHTGVPDCPVVRIKYTETLKRRRAVRDQVESLYRHQLKSKVDLDLILVETSNAELALIRAQNDFKSNVATLNNAMGLQGPDAYDLQRIELSVSPPPDIESLVTEGLQNRPELIGGRDKIEASDELLKAVKALNFGSVSAVGSIGVTKYWDAHDSGIHDNQVAPFWGVGATARLPLFTGFKIRNQIAEASHLRGEAEYELQDVANEVVLQVIRAYLTQTTNAEQIGLERQRVEYAKEALTLAQERYRIGLSPIIGVIRATAVAFEAESGLAEAQYIYKTSEAVVAYATGQDYKRY